MVCLTVSQLMAADPKVLSDREAKTILFDSGDLANFAAGNHGDQPTTDGPTTSGFGFGLADAAELTLAGFF